MIPPSELSQLRAAAVKRTEAVAELAQRICEVPAPTGNEWDRAQLVASLWRERGYVPEIDDIGNVYIRRGKRENGPVLMLLAHTDTVFPQTTPVSVERQADILRGPGIGDNSVSVAAMISALDVLDELGIETGTDIVAVADVGKAYNKKLFINAVVKLFNWDLLVYGGNILTIIALYYGEI